jgi:hypothetical protein
MVSYPAYAHITLAFTALGFVFIGTVILAKYSAYPGPMNLPEAILLLLCVYLPPLLLIMIPFFYKKAMNNLRRLLP